MKKSEQLRRISRELDLTLREFADEVGVSPRMLDYYLADKKGTPPQKVMNSAYWIYWQRTGKNFSC